MKFTYQYDEAAPLVEFTLPPDVSLAEVIEEFEKFLLASGYYFDGHLDFTEDEEPNEDPLPF